MSYVDVDGKPAMHEFGGWSDALPQARSVELLCYFLCLTKFYRAKLSSRLEEAVTSLRLKQIKFSDHLMKSRTNGQSPRGRAPFSDAKPRRSIAKRFPLNLC